MVEHSILAGPDLFAQNTFENPLAVVPKNEIPVVGTTVFQIVLPKLSWHVFRFIVIK